MKYYNIIDVDEGIAIWAVRPDGKERCLYASSGKVGEHNDWHKPEDYGDHTINELLNSNFCKVKRIKKSDINEIIFLDY